MPWKSPTTEDLSYIARAATESMIICSPFITRPGIDVLARSVPNSISMVEVWTKFDPRDWMTGATELDGLLDFLETLPRSTRIELRISDRLHAKFIVANGRVGVVGSANLTYGGFSGNIEVVRIVESPEIDELMDYINSVRGYLSVASLDDLRAFVSRCQNQAHEKEALLDLIRGALPVAPPGRGPIVPLSEFIRFSGAQNGFVVNEVKKIYFNTDGNNRTGHLKQAYYAVQRFFQEHPEHLGIVSRASLNAPFDLAEHRAIYNPWLDFLGGFEDEADGSFAYDFGILRGYLTPTFGGWRIGGGGGDYPFRLVWPLVARMMA